MWILQLNSKTSNELCPHDCLLYPFFSLAETKLRGCWIDFKPSYTRFNHAKRVYLFMEVLPVQGFSKICK